jgi:hypothetical protein
LGCPFAINSWLSLNLFVPDNSEHVEILESFGEQLHLPFLHGDHHHDILGYLGNAK